MMQRPLCLTRPSSLFAHELLRPLDGGSYQRTGLSGGDVTPIPVFDLVGKAKFFRELILESLRHDTPSTFHLVITPTYSLSPSLLNMRRGGGTSFRLGN